jgi:hypothetical protein
MDVVETGSPIFAMAPVVLVVLAVAAVGWYAFHPR